MSRTNGTGGAGADDRLAVGVVGVGSMGRNHARVYSELPAADLVGVADVDRAAAEEVADGVGTDACSTADLLDRADAVSVAVPTAHHADAVEACIDAGVHALVEKPFVLKPERGRELADRAAAAGVHLGVGHVERFNPAVATLADVVADLDIIAVDARRLGPPLDRELDDSAVMDLMIHDIDVVCSLLDASPTTVSATGTDGNRYATATCRFPDDVVASFTASRVTQRKVRRLGVTARECRVVVDYTAQSVEIHRHSLPAYVDGEHGPRHRTESVVERPMVESGEPLRRELASFVAAVGNDEPPEVTAEDGIRAVEVATLIDCVAAGKDRTEVAS